MAPTLYYIDASPPVRSVLLVAKAIGLELNLKFVNLMTGEHMTPEFLKMNPQHTVPTLEDEGFYVWDSHAISTYLISKYGKDDSLYPKDLKKRATIDQRLHFNSNIIQPRVSSVFSPIIRQGQTTIPKENQDSLLAAYDFLETFLEGKTYIAGDQLSVADLCIVGPMSSITPFVPLDKAKTPKLEAWLKRMESLPYYKAANEEGLNKLVAMIKSKLV